MDDRRRVGRVRTLLKGRILFNNRSSSMDCVVRDFSLGGARLLIGDTTSLPDHFELHVPHKERYYPCALTWRTKTEIGVAFAPAGQEAGTAELLRRISELQNENAELRRQLAAGPGGRPELPAVAGDEGRHTVPARG